MGNLSLPQQIFLTQESNQDFLYCRQILYQLIYQGMSSSHKKYTERWVGEVNYVGAM